MTCGIYVIDCHGLPYVGQSVNIEQRWDAHIRALKRTAHGNPIMQNTWNKYGRDAFSFRILEECAHSLLSKREHWWCLELRSYSNQQGCNIAPVMKNAVYSRVRSPETIAKHAEFMRSRIDTKRSLSPSDVLDIWLRYMDGEGTRRLGLDYGIDGKSIRLIIARVYYREIELPASCRCAVRRRGRGKKKNATTSIPTAAGATIPSE